MDDHLSPAAQRALENACRYAHGRNAGDAQLIDLLAGLLLDEESKAITFLKEQGADPEELRVRLELPVLLAETVESSFPLSVETRNAVALAKQHVLALNRYDQVGSQELLAAVLECWVEDTAGFRHCGLDIELVVREYYRSREPEPMDIPTDSLDLQTSFAVDGPDIARVMDANANRAREALRVLEDHARFVLDDQLLCESLKQCRHQLRNALEHFPASWFLTARDTTADVGVWVSTREEFARSNFADVLQANCKRAQEAMRSLEECAKVENANAARLLEQVRYQLYTLEKQILLGMRANSRLDGVQLYWLVDPEVCAGELEWMLAQAIDGGVQIVQLRDKSCADAELLSLARRFRAVCRSLGALFIVNDRPDIARLSGADGVHLGQDDLTVRDARRILGSDAVIGVSTHNIEQAQKAVREGADYIGVGPVFPSKTKQFSEFAGLDYVRQVAQTVRIPAFCIGGIDCENIGQVVEAGGSRVVVGNALTTSKEPRPVAMTLRNQLINR